MSKILEKLANVQCKMKVQKNAYNKFGDFKYRRLEDILEALKPYQEEEKVTLVLRDDLHVIGSSVYVKAIATLYDQESDEKVEVCAFAKEPDQPKAKMDSSQTTGSASTYARKYCLQAMFLLDDGVDEGATDPDGQSGKETKKTTTYSKPTPAPAKPVKQSKSFDRESFKTSVLNLVGDDTDLLMNEFEMLGIKSLDTIDERNAKLLWSNLKNRLKNK